MVPGILYRSVREHNPLFYIKSMYSRGLLEVSRQNFTTIDSAGGASQLTGFSRQIVRRNQVMASRLTDLIKVRRAQRAELALPLPAEPPTPVPIYFQIYPAFNSISYLRVHAFPGVWMLNKLPSRHLR